MTTEQPTRIVRAKHSSEEPYFIMRRATAQDETLTWSARGVLTYLLSKPNDWVVQPHDLQQKCGRDKVYVILNELIDARYIVREAIRDKGRVLYWEYQVYESPVSPLPEKPDLVAPDQENPDSTEYRLEHSTEDTSIVSGANAALTSTPAVPISYLRSELIALDNGLLYMLSRRIPTEWHIARDSISLCGKHNRGSLNLMYHDESSAPLCSLCLKIAQEGPLAPADAVALPAKPKRGKQSANGAQKRAPKERAPQPTDPAFDAVVRFLTEKDTVPPQDRKANDWRVGQILFGEKKRNTIGLVDYECERQGCERSTLDYVALASDIDLFNRSFRKHHADLELKDCVKWLEYWVKFRAAQQKRQPRRIVNADCDQCHGSGVIEWIEEPGCETRIYVPGELLGPKANKSISPCNCQQQRISVS